MSQIISTPLTITCADGYVLAGTSYCNDEQPIGAVMMAPATGIKRQFYHAFATFLAEQGYGVVTFDNRGIGESLQGEVAKSDASIQCWGEQDLPGALEHLKDLFPNVPYHVVGHSAGGQLLGLMPNARDLSSFYNVACSSGSLRNMRMPYAVKAQIFMNIFIPLSNLFAGHTKSQLMGMGEPLPKAVAQQWRQWCNGQGYVKTAFGRTIHQHYYDELAIPSMWLRAVDDDIANEKNVDEMIAVYTKSPAQKVVVSPQDIGLNEVGHMKFFSRKSNQLWPAVCDWLTLHNKQAV